MWLAVPAGVGFGDGEAEVFEFGDELAQAAVVVEPGLVVGELVVGQDAGGGLAVFLAGPLVVGPYARAVSLRLTDRSPWMLESMCSRCAMSFAFLDGEFAALVHFGRARCPG